jgi:predicted aldo/keto reductase-like oxidoreductase
MKAGVMLYRHMKGCERELSILGFGCMRLPTNDDDTINEVLAKKVIRYAIDRGVNYIDTAYPYHRGQSEPFVGRVLKDGYRERVNLATKLPSWLIGTRGDMDKYLGEQIERLHTDNIDFYLIHGLNKTSWDKLEELGVIVEDNPTGTTWRRK